MINSVLLPQKKSAMTLIEVVVTVAVIALISIPLFQVLTVNKKIGVSAAKRTIALNLASSWIASVVTMPKEAFYIIETQEDTAVEGFLSLDSLGVNPSPKGFLRFVTIEELPSDEAGALIFHVLVSVQWMNRKSGKVITFELNRLLTFSVDS